MSVTQVLLSCNHIIMIATLLPTWRCDYKTFGLIFKSYPTANQCFVNESSSRNKVAVGELVSGITYSWYLFSDLVTSDPRNEFSTGIMITPLVTPVTCIGYQWWCNHSDTCNLDPGPHSCCRSRFMFMLQVKPGDYTTGPYDFNNIYNPGSPLVTYVIPGLYVVKVSWSSLIFMKDRIYDM
jgi:hypothetical protein